jgi:hypothetical protein
MTKGLIGFLQEAGGTPQDDVQQIAGITSGGSAVSGGASQ